MAENDFDIWRDSKVRYLGYTNELGESFRPLIPRALVNATYGVSGLYVLCDTYDKMNRAKKAPNATTASVATQALDTLLWQGFASVIVPGFTIHQVVKYMGKLTTRLRGLPPAARTWIPSLVGLGVIPFIVHPIDHGVHKIMDHTVRPLFQRVAASDE